MNKFLIAFAIAAFAVVSVSSQGGPISQSGNGTPGNDGTATSGYTSAAANCGQVELDVFNINAAGIGQQDLFQYITFNGGQGVNFASSIATPYIINLPTPITNGGVELEIIISSLQGSFVSATGTSGPFNSSVDYIMVQMNPPNGPSLTQNYSVKGNNFTFLAGFLGPQNSSTVNNFSVVIAQVYPAQGVLSTNSTCTVVYQLEILNGISVRGDPQFVGLRGQTYQIHGIDGAIYNLITDKTYQLNSRFAFLTGPRPCPLMPSHGRKSAACWSHPGSYLSQLGLKVSGFEIYIAAGPANVGFTTVTVNDKAMKIGEITPLISFNSTHEVVLTFGEWTIEVENSDMFVNLRSVSVTPDFWTKQTTHGLLGQTWNNKRYSSKVSAIDGDIDDYLVYENNVFGSDHVFNRYTQ